MNLKDNKLILNGVLIFSILSLSTAYFIQYVLGHKPCNLCLIERIPYIVTVVLLTLIFIFNRFHKFFSIIVLLFFIFGALISFYHFGIEQGFINESLVCDLGDKENLNKDQLLKQLENTSIISCKNVTFRVLGFSLATINTIISIILSVIMISTIKNYDKN